MNAAHRISEASRILGIAVSISVHTGGTVQSNIKQAYANWRMEYFNDKMHLFFDASIIHAEMDEMKAVMLVLGFTL
jgi:hypothetical protein